MNTLHPNIITDELLLKVQMNALVGAEVIWVSGHNPDVDALTEPETIWELGNNYTLLSAPQRLWIHSSNSSDLHKVKIEGLDGSYNRIVEEVTLNGTTSVQTTNTFLRVNSMFNTSGTPSVGTVYLSKVTGSILSTEVVSMYLPQFQMSKNSSYAIPNGYTGFLFQGEAFLGKNKDATVYFSIKTPDGVFMVYDAIPLYQCNITAIRPFIRISGKSDLKVSATSENVNTPITISYGLLLLKD